MNGKTLLAASCAVSLACGYIAGKAGDKSSAGGFVVTQSSPRPHARENRSRSAGDSTLLNSILGGRPIAEIPHAELAALIARLSKSEEGMDPLLRIKQAYQLQLLFAKLRPANLAAIADYIITDSELKASGVQATVLAAIARKDPDRALARLSSGEVTVGCHSAVISAIAEDDPLRAADLLRHYIVELESSGNNLWIARNDVARAMAKLGAAPILGYLDSLPAHRHGNSVFNILDSVPADERVKLLEGIHQRMRDGRIRGISFDHLFATTLSYDATSAKEWLSKLPDEREKNGIRLVTSLSLLERGEKEAASQWLREAFAASPGKEKAVFESILWQTVNNNPDGAAYLAKILPHGVEFTVGELEHFARCSFFSGTGGLSSIASILRDPADQARLIATALEKGRPDGSTPGKFKPSDFDILSRRIAAMGFTGDNAILVNNALDAARNP